jgi:hypothetical protein
MCLKYKFSIFNYDFPVLLHDVTNTRVLAIFFFSSTDNWWYPIGVPAIVFCRNFLRSGKGIDIKIRIILIGYLILILKFFERKYQMFYPE